MTCRRIALCLPLLAWLLVSPAQETDYRVLIHGEQWSVLDTFETQTACAAAASRLREEAQRLQDEVLRGEEPRPPKEYPSPYWRSAWPSWKHELYARRARTRCIQ